MGKHPTPILVFVPCVAVNSANVLRSRGILLNWRKKEIGSLVLAGANKWKSAGHGKLVYAMRVDKKFTRWKYFTDSQFEQKKPVKTGTYEQTRGDNVQPLNDFEMHKQFALVSWQFYYFGAKAIDIPGEFNLEKKGPWFRYVDPADFCRFVALLERKYKPGKHGEPCYRVPADELKGSKRCESSC